jgi:phosphoribosylamine--glycine ligase
VSSARPRVLIVGKDARTDAIAAACARSPQQPRLFGVSEMVAPGLLQRCERLFTVESLTDLGRFRQIVDEVAPDLAIIGPEEPLEAGYVDALGEHNIPAFGPSADLAAIETSKSWTRSLIDKYEIPGNPDYRVFRDHAGLQGYMEELGSFVIKPDGLTAGKGVRVFGEHLHSIDEAVAYAGHLLAEDGAAQIEDRLQGEEFSLQTITDGEHFIHCPPVQDHKRSEVGDKGPNTGGMGSYSDVDHSLPFLDAEDLAEAQSINEKVIHALRGELGRPYRGVLYGGFMAVADGVRVIEYNARFGDPEAMNVLPILNADFVELCTAAARGQLKDASWSFDRKATVCKYVVPEDYPGGPPSGETLNVPPDLRDRPNLKWYWAACEQRGDEVYLSTSRTGAFVGIGDSLAEAEQIAEQAIATIDGPVRHRPDIGRPDVLESRVAHMRALRSRARQPTGTVKRRVAA